MKLTDIAFTVYAVRDAKRSRDFYIGCSMKACFYVLMLALAVFTTSAAQPASTKDKSAFERLKTLTGEWEGNVDGRENGPPVKVVYRVTSNGSIVTETLFAGTDHEMLTVYYLDQATLVLVHYCAAGNQPRMVLSKSSTSDHLVFEFSSGSNLDVSKDTHMHSARINFESRDSLRSEWESYKDGKPSGSHVFSLRRKA